MIGHESCRAQSCDCRKGDYNEAYTKLASIGKANHKIIVCGLAKEGAFLEDSAHSDPSWKFNLHTELLVTDCKTSDTLFYNEMMMDAPDYTVTATERQIDLTRMVFIHYHHLDYLDPPLPLSVTHISLNGDKPIVSQAEPVFVMPAFSAEVRDSAIKFYNRLEVVLKVSPFAQWANYNQYPTDLLLTAALMNIGRSRELYRNLRDHFDLDGAVSEDYDPGYLDLILDNIRKGEKIVKK